MLSEIKFSILYVDDEISNLRIFENTFRKEYIIFTAKSAKEGISILENEQIDIILSDQRMPEMTGVDFLKYTLKNHPDLNRILITGYTDFSAIKNAINDAKIYQFIQKPWREDDLNNTIKEALRVYQLEIENKELFKNLKEVNKSLIIEKDNAEEKEVLIQTQYNELVASEEEIRANNEELIIATEELKKHRDNLEKLVEERTNELKLKNKDLEEFNELFIGREFRIKELKDQVADLKEQIIKLKK